MREENVCTHTHTQGHMCVSMCADMCTRTTPSRQKPPPRVGETKWGRGGHQAAAEPPGESSRPVAFSLLYGASSSGIILALRGKRADIFLKGGVRHNRYRLHKSSDVSFCLDSAVPLKNKLKPDGKGGRDKAGPRPQGAWTLRSPRDLLVGFPPPPALWQVSGRPGWGAESGERASEGEGWGPGSTPRHLGFFGDHGTVVAGSGRATGQCPPSAPHRASPADQEEVRGGAREQGGSGRDASAPPLPPSALQRLP